MHPSKQNYKMKYGDFMNASEFTYNPESKMELKPLGDGNEHHRFLLYEMPASTSPTR